VTTGSASGQIYYNFALQVDKYIDKVLDGFNVNVCVLGPTGAGADVVLDGMPGAPKEHGQAQGITLLAVQALFDKLHKKSLEVLPLAQSHTCFFIERLTPMH